VSTNRTDNDHGDHRRELLDTPGVARFIASSVRHVRRMVAERTIPHYKVGYFVRFDPDEIDQWLQRHRRGPNNDRPAA
jgi:excisionase family DNA binding protein